MSHIFKTGQATASRTYNALRVTTAQYGQPIHVVYGRTRVSSQLIYAGNFQTHNHSGKKGKGNVYYTVNADYCMGYGPMQGIGHLWIDRNYFQGQSNSGADTSDPFKLSQTFTFAGPATSFTCTCTPTHQMEIVIGVAVQQSYSVTYNDYGGPGSINLSGTTLLPLYNNNFHAPNNGTWSNAGIPYATYNSTVSDVTVNVYFPTAQSNVTIIVYFQAAGNNTGSALTTTGIQFERQLGSGTEGSPITYPEFSGFGMVNWNMQSANILPNFDSEPHALYGYGQHGDVNPADIIIDLICSGNLNSLGLGATWNHGLGFTRFNPGNAYNYSRYGGILQDEPNLYSGAGGGSNIGLNTVRNYCQANGIFISDALDAQDTAARHLGDLCEIANCAPVWDGAELWFIPYSEVSQYGNGASYVAPTGSGSVQAVTSGLPGSFVSPSAAVGNFSNPSYAYDGNLNTSAAGPAGAPGNPTSMQETWSGFPAGTTSGQQLNVSCWAEGFTAGTSDSVSVEYSFDGGATWHLLVGFTSFANQKTYSVAIPDGTAQANIQVQCTSSTHAAGSVVAGIVNEIWIDSAASPVSPGSFPTPPGPLLTLTPKDFILDNNAPPVTVQRARPQDNYNSLPIEFSDRSNMYNVNSITVSDAMDITIQGPMPGASKSYHWIKDSTTAQLVGRTLLKRALMVKRKTYKFKLPAQHSLFIPMDLVLLSEPSLGPTPVPVRFTKITENADFTLDCEAEPFIYGASAPIIPAATGTPTPPSSTPVATNVDPGSVNAPIIFEAIPAISASPQIWFALSGANQYYGGCHVWVSTDDGNTYSLAGTAGGSNTMGVTYSADYPNHADPDAADTLNVDLTESLGSLSTYTAAQRDQFDSLCLLTPGGTVTLLSGQTLTIPYELVAYATANLSSANKYALPPTIRRGVFGTPTADHPTGSNFSFLNDGFIFKLNLPQAWIGQTLYFKFTAFNVYGNAEQDIATVTAYSFTPTGLVGWSWTNGGTSGSPGGGPTGTPTPTGGYTSKQSVSGTGTSFALSTPGNILYVVWNGQVRFDFTQSSSTAFTTSFTVNSGDTLYAVCD